MKRKYVRVRADRKEVVRGKTVRRRTVRGRTMRKRTVVEDCLGRGLTGGL